MKRLKRLRAWLAARFPGADVFAGAGQGLVICAWSLLAITVLLVGYETFSAYTAITLPLIVILLLLSTALVLLGFNLIRRANRQLLTGIAFFSIVALVIIEGGMGTAGMLAVVVLGLGSGLVGGGWATYQRRGLDWRALAAGVPGVLLVGVWVVAYFTSTWPTEETRELPGNNSPQLAIPDPALPGPFTFQHLHYGSGDNPQRAEFGKNTDVITERVDGSQLIDGWEGRNAWVRTSYWDVTADRLPLNGSAWVPDGPGPFPVVLIVHGNHAMEDYSDSGYDYLGELFASQGILTVSVDQNFLNSSLGNLLGMPDSGLDEENDARGWLLLKHLEQFRRWNEDPQHPLSGKADLSRVVLIGHSRGGEAVSEAAVFNRLSAYPDDALLQFNFNFGIRGIIAIAPVDMQYHPRNDHTKVRDVSYLVIHGSHDADVTSYSGYATYNRTRFSDCDACFKAGYYVVGANHGQFNTAWGATDFPSPVVRWLNLNHLMSGEDQRQIARVLFSAFLQVTLFDDRRYVPLLASPDRATALFPDSAFLLTQFTSAAETVVADYLEDDDVHTATLPGARLSAENLSLWREQHIDLKWHKTGSAAAIMGWRPQPDPDDEVVESAGENAGENAAEIEVKAPRYTIHLPPGLLHRDSKIILSVAALPETPGEMAHYEAPDTVDFSLEVSDADGAAAQLPLSRRRALTKQLDPNVLKFHSLQANRSEVVFHRYAFAVNEWLDQNSTLDPTAVNRLTLVFDRTEAATIALERVSIQ